MVKWLCITREREEKSSAILRAFGQCLPGAELVMGPPPEDGAAFAVWGQMWLAMELIPKALATGRDFWQIDNGYWRSAKGTAFGYYRATFNGLAPVLLPAPDMERPKNLGVRMAKWRGAGRHVLFAVPNDTYGRCCGLNMHRWCEQTAAELRRTTDRPVRNRAKTSKTALSDDLRDCWAVVTHSSNVAVDAVLAGVPVFVAPTNPAAPVGNLDLGMLENPVMPEREHWLASLLTQQYTLSEMANGYSASMMPAIVEQYAHERHLRSNAS